MIETQIDYTSKAPLLLLLLLLFSLPAAPLQTRHQVKTVPLMEATSVAVSTRGPLKPVAQLIWYQNG